MKQQDMYAIEEENMNTIKAEIKSQNTKWYKEKMNEVKVHPENQKKNQSN